jgi:uncharacterized SAM-dependent methyltransferase
MHLISTVGQEVQCQGTSLYFAKGESIHSESSYKYTLESFAELARQAGFQGRKLWLDEASLFSVRYLV